MGLYSVYLPAAGQNLITNPSLESDLANWAAYLAGSTVTRSTEDAAFEGASAKVVVNGAAADQGVKVSGFTLAANALYAGSIYFRGVAGAVYRIRAFDVGAGTGRGSVTITATGRWQRAMTTWTTVASGAYELHLTTNSARAETFYADGAQVETSEVTTYMDGDQPGCGWNGKRQASTSFRSDQWRGGGRIVDLDTFGLRVVDHVGVGAAGYNNVSTDNGIIGGATYQRSIVRPRAFGLITEFKSSPLSSLAALHADRQALMDALKPNRVSPQQPIVLRYNGGPDPRIIHCHYEAGLDDGAVWLSLERQTIRFVAFDPYWYAEHTAAKWLSAFDTITDANYAVERTSSGTFRSMAGGLSGSVRAAVYAEDGSLYVAGTFLTAYNAAGGLSPVTVNRIAKWSGTEWSALGAGFNNTVLALAMDPAGNLYAGGAFTDAGSPYLAKWNGSSWSAVGSASAGTGAVHALAYNAVNGHLYIAGLFDNWNAIAAADGIVRWDGAAYAALGTGLTPTEATQTVSALAIDGAGSVTVGGAFQVNSNTAIRNVARWNIRNAAWESLSFPYQTGTSVWSLAYDAAGRLYTGGSFTNAGFPYLVQWNGSSWSAVGGGVNESVHTLVPLPDRRLLVGGRFTSAGGLALRDRAVLWNGSAFETLPIDLPGTATIYAAAHNVYTNELAFGYDTSGSATASNTTDVTINNNGTEEAAPLIHIGHAGTIEAIINWTSGKAIYFDLQLQAGEVAWLDLSVLTPQHLPVFKHAGDRSGPRLWSSFRGDITRFILPNSDLATWRLLPGANTVLVKTRNAAPGSNFRFSWRPRYISNDA